MKSNRGLWEPQWSRWGLEGSAGLGILTVGQSSRSLTLVIGLILSLVCWCFTSEIIMVFPVASIDRLCGYIEVGRVVRFTTLELWKSHPWFRIDVTLYVTPWNSNFISPHLFPRAWPCSPLFYFCLLSPCVIFYHIPVPSSRLCPFFQNSAYPTPTLIPVFPIFPRVPHFSPDCQLRDPILDLLIPPCCAHFPAPLQ